MSESSFGPSFGPSFGLLLDAVSDPSPDPSFRRAGPQALAAALQASRRDTLATLACFEAALPNTQVPRHADLNPPLWELGHIHWFAQHWLARNPQRALGAKADPQARRSAALAPDDDRLFDSSRVAHSSRWDLPLPPAAALKDMLAEGLERTLALLTDCAPDDDSLYFHRLVLAHEDMHHEAALYMAQALGVPVADARWQPQALTTRRDGLFLESGPVDLGWHGDGFAFDNELGAHRIHLPDSTIDSRVLTWAEYLPFVTATGQASPRYLRRHGGGWQQQHNGQWLALDMDLPACHLRAQDAQAWCAWAGRRLPTEAEWERAAVQAGSAFVWGAVWEWTASPFAPYPGFTPHPYLDYSAPWFGTRRVLRGASIATQPRLRDVRYRNFYAPDRDDIFAGFRTCAA